MTSSSPEIEYRCLNDCRQEGCPGHKIKAFYSHVSDTLRFETSTGTDLSIDFEDENRFAAMMKAFGEIKW